MLRKVSRRILSFAFMAALMSSLIWVLRPHGVNLAVGFSGSPLAKVGALQYRAQAGRPVALLWPKLPLLGLDNV